MRKGVKKMKAYMEKMKKNDDELMKRLCQDIYIIYKTLNTPRSIMYSGTLQHSQGRQTSYNISQIENKDVRPNKIEDFDSIDSLDDFNSFDSINMNHTTPKQKEIMRQVSQKVPYKENDSFTQINNLSYDNYDEKSLEENELFR